MGTVSFLDASPIAMVMLSPYGKVSVDWYVFHNNTDRPWSNHSGEEENQEATSSLYILCGYDGYGQWRSSPHSYPVKVIIIHVPCV